LKKRNQGEKTEEVGTRYLWEEAKRGGKAESRNRQGERWINPEGSLRIRGFQWGDGLTSQATLEVFATKQERGGIRPGGNEEKRFSVGRGRYS